MKAGLRTGLLIVVLSPFGATPLEAQWGGILDKLYELSGPRLEYYGGVFRFGYQPGQRIERTTVEDLQIVPLSFGDPDGLRTFAPGAQLRFAQLVQCTDATSELIVPLNGQVRDEGTVDRVRRDVGTLRNEAALVRRSFMLLDSLSNLREIDPSRQAEMDSAAVRHLRQTGLIAQIESLERTSCSLLERVRRTSADPGHGWVGRIGAFYMHDRNGLGIEGAALQVSLEHMWDVNLGGFLGNPDLGIEVGIRASIFDGGDGASFAEWSVPIMANYHPFARCSSAILRNFRIGAGAHLFPDFEDSDFPILGSNASGFQAAFGYFFAWDLSLSAFAQSPNLDCSG